MDTINHKIFLVEDNKTEGLLFKMALNNINYLSIKHFTKGNDLLKSIDENPDIIILDLKLPDYDEIELIRKIKEYDPSIKLIVVSSQRDIDHIATIQEMGIYNYLVKSEGVLQYLNNVIKDLLTIIENKKQSMKNNYKIFLTEDNKTEGLLFKMTIHKIEGVSLKQFTKGGDLLENLSENPDIIILDLKLPDFDGVELIRKIKQYDPSIRIIVVSSQRDIDLIAHIQEMGVYNYLVKSEGVLKYLKDVIKDLLTILESNNKESKNMTRPPWALKTLR